ncbi:MAG TPA: hypothetical protein VG798_03720 [Rhizomicrobium sp.]|nr:hypothetical protein [Rhizomicrobium sp.]
MRRSILLALLLLPAPAWAGAWTEGRGKWQLISGLIASEADRTFGTTAPISFRRALFQNYLEYGFRDGITLIGATETATVRIVQNGGAPFQTVDNAFAAGIRVRLDRYLKLGANDTMAVEAGWREAGAFNFAVSANRSAGGQGEEVHFLYGHTFKLGGRDGYIDIATGRDFLTGGRADETPFDFTAGWWISKSHLLMAQSFNLFSGAGRTAAYPAFNSHKLELSWVWRRSARTLFQLGAFYSPAGNNALVEEGVAFSVWRRN